MNKLKDINIYLSFDTDWCAEDMISDIVELLEEKKIKSTFFLTDDFPKVNSKYVELAFHPNIENMTVNEVDNYLNNNIKKFKSNILGIRTHKLYSSAVLNIFLEKYNILYQSNYVLFLQDNITPCKGLNGIYEMPIYFMDYYLLEFYKKVPNYSEFKKDFFNGKGLKIFDFHPIHIYLNTPSFEYYFKYKNSLKINSEVYGMRDFFIEFIDDLQHIKTSFIGEIL